MNAVRRLGETARAFKRTWRLVQLQGRRGGVRGDPIEEQLVPSTSAAPALAAPAATVAVSVAIAEGQIIGIMRRLGSSSGPDPLLRLTMISQTGSTCRQVVTTLPPN